MYKIEARYTYDKLIEHFKNAYLYTSEPNHNESKKKNMKKIIEILEKYKKYFESENDYEKDLKACRSAIKEYALTPNAKTKKRPENSTTHKLINKFNKILKCKYPDFGDDKLDEFDEYRVTTKITEAWSLQRIRNLIKFLKEWTTKLNGLSNENIKDYTSISRQRIRMCILGLIYSGCRIGEFVNLPFGEEWNVAYSEHCGMEIASTKIIGEKNKIERYVFLPLNILNFIRNHRCKNGKYVSQEGIKSMLYQLSISNKEFKKCSCRTFRTTMSTLAREYCEVDEDRVKVMLGHKGGSVVAIHYIKYWEIHQAFECYFALLNGRIKLKKNINKYIDKIKDLIDENDTEHYEEFKDLLNPKKEEGEKQQG